MTSPLTFPVDANTVRGFLNLSVDSTSRYTDSTISSNVRTAGQMLERMTHRYLMDRTAATVTISTGGADAATIPGLRTATSVTRVGAPLTANASYYLLPDTMQTGLYTGISFGQVSWREPAYLGNPEWFDRDLDNAKYRAMGSVPNDLVIVGDWGFTDALMPDDLLMGVKELAAYLTKLADANMAGFLATPDGNAFDLSNLPPVVQGVVAQWALGSGVAGA